MRLCGFIRSQLRFLLRYGIIALYVLLTVLYLCLLRTIPAAWRQAVLSVLVFSDPAAMGLFFMGAVILLEKSQHTPFALAVSPIRAGEYAAAQVISFACVGLAVAGVLGAGVHPRALPGMLAGTLLASVIFTLIGLILAAHAGSLNRFLVYSIPVEVLGFLPALLFVLSLWPDELRLYPSIVIMELITGRLPDPMGLVLTGMLLAALIPLSHRAVLTLWGEGKGANS